jgi:hypothetical protein
MPGWLLAEVAEGLQRLLLLRLDGAPPADTIEGVVMAWTDALLMRGRWEEVRDAPRLRHAFRALAAHSLRWPAPAQLLQHVPDPPAVVALPKPPPTKEQQERVKAMLADIANMLRE